MLKRKRKEPTPEELEQIHTKDFFDMIFPGTIKFLSDRYIVGDSYRCVWAIREYPPSTEEQAILSRLADRSGVTLRIYHRPVDSMEQRKIVQNATRKNKLKSGGNDVTEAIEAESNLQDLMQMIANQKREQGALLHCSVFIELKAQSIDGLKELRAEVNMELTRSKILVDRLTLRQKEGFLSVLPVGANMFGTQYERVLPVSSVANLYPFSYSGKTDPNGIYIGKDKYGSNILVDFDRRSEDKTTSNILILGNSGQGKSYLLKLILTNLRESGKSIICLDPESEYEEICSALGGCYIDFMSGEHTINPLEPKAWNDGTDTSDPDAPTAFRKVTRLSQHIAYLKDFFRAYKDFSDSQIDTIEILLSKLYARFGINDSTDYSKLKATDYPIMEDFYKLCEEEFMSYDNEQKHLYTEETLQEVCLGLHSMCIGSESKYFNGHSNITDNEFLVFGVKGLLDTNKRLKDAMLFNILSFMSNQLLGKGNTAASVDELYLFLTNLTAIEYIRNCMKRVRKKDSSIILASQNIEDFLIPSIREFNTSFSQNYCVFEDIDFGNPGLKQIYFDQASNKDSVAIGNTYLETNLEVRLDNPNGTLVAALNGKRTGDWFNFTEVNVNVTADVTGRHDIYVIAKQPSFLIRSIRMEQKSFTSIINLQSTSRFASYNSIINRPTTSGVPAYNYCPFIVKLSNDLGGGYRTYFGGRWLSSAGDGDHVFQYRSSSGVANSWSMYGNGPQFWQGREEGSDSKWFADNVLEPEVMRLPDGNWAMYTQVQIDPGKVIDDGNDSVAVAQADRILLLTSNDGNKWYRKEDSSVITNITNPTATACHHQELVYVPWDENGKCYWMYIAVNENNVYKGYYRIRSNRYDNFNFAARERVSGMIQLGNQIGYLKQTDGAPIFVRITFADYDGRLVPALQYSTNGLSWSGIINYLAGSTDNNNNKNCYFMGFSTINGTGEMIYEGNNTWSFLYAATTSNSPVQPEIWHSAIGGGNAQIIIS